MGLTTRNHNLKGINMIIKELAAFENFAIDHIKHFDAIPCEFEESSGDVFSSQECWNAAEKLNLLNLVIDVTNN